MGRHDSLTTRTVGEPRGFPTVSWITFRAVTANRGRKRGGLSRSRTTVQSGSHGQHRTALQLLETPQPGLRNQLRNQSPFGARDKRQAEAPGQRGSATASLTCQSLAAVLHSP